MSRCLKCHEREAVESTSFIHDMKRSAKEFSKWNLFGLGTIARAWAYNQNTAPGRLMRCKYCRAYHFLCFHCDKLSLLDDCPPMYAKLICPHCSKTVILDYDISGTNDDYMGF